MPALCARPPPPIFPIFPVHNPLSFHPIQPYLFTLSSPPLLLPRYITTRFLPDKAIDLVDEACSTVRVQLDSKPESIDSLERQAVRLRVEKEALKKEKDPLSVARLGEVEKELAALEDTLRPLLVGRGMRGRGGGMGRTVLVNTRAMQHVPAWGYRGHFR